jgi:hypothetical protein
VKIKRKSRCNTTPQLLRLFHAPIRSRNFLEASSEHKSLCRWDQLMPRSGRPSYLLPYAVLPSCGGGCSFTSYWKLVCLTAKGHALVGHTCAASRSKQQLKPSRFARVAQFYKNRLQTKPHISLTPDRPVIRETIGDILVKAFVHESLFVMQGFSVPCKINPS